MASFEDSGRCLSGEGARLALRAEQMLAELSLTAADSDDLEDVALR